MTQYGAQAGMAIDLVINECAPISALPRPMN